MDIFGGGDASHDALKAFRETLGKYKHHFNEITTNGPDMQDTAKTKEVIRLIDNLYARLHPILQKFKGGQEVARPTQDTPLEYDFFTTGKLEYLYRDRAAAAEFERYLKMDLKSFPFTYETGIIDSYKGIHIDPPTIISNTEIV